jgi:hypothetical protein
MGCAPIPPDLLPVPSAHFTFRRAADTDSGDKIAVPLLVPTPYVIELIAAKVGRESFKEGIEASHSLASIYYSRPSSF